MAGPNYGLLGSTFKIVRILQMVSLIACVGMAANFISDMVMSNESPSKELVGTLSVVSRQCHPFLSKTRRSNKGCLDQTCIAVLYCAITTILHIDGSLPYLINTGLDGMMLIALVVVAAVVGKPLSFLNCKVIGTSSVSESTYQLGNELKNQLHNNGGQVVYSNWIGASRSVCYEMKAIWGLSIALW